MEFGALCLLPLAVIIIMAIFTKRGIESLLVGVIVSYIMLNGMNFFWPLIDGLYAALSDEDTVWILLVCVFLGSLSILFERSKGVHGLARILIKWATTQKKSLIASWLAGLIIFMDDYLNIFVVGALMKKVTDKNNVPREMLAYVVDSTAAPVCLIVPLSSWMVFFSVILGEQKELASLGSGTSLYYHSIPFIFYAWLTVIVVPLIIFGVIPKFGPMQKAYERASTGKLVSDESAKLAANVNEEVISENEGNMLYFVIPVLLLIGVTIWQNDVLIGLIAANAVCIVLLLLTRAMNFNKLCDNILDGFASAMPLVTICAVSVFARGAFTELKIADYLISVATPYLSPMAFPALTFILVATLAFVTVSCWGIVAVSIPILIPIAVAVGANPFLTIGAILSGSGFGSHACPYEDASVLTSQVTGISYIEHFITQAPFAAIAAAGSVILYLIFGFTM